MESLKEFRPAAHRGPGHRLRHAIQNLLPGTGILAGIPNLIQDPQGVRHHAGRDSPEMPQPGVNAVNFFPGDFIGGLLVYC
jgi:hypothetical protein